MFSDQVNLILLEFCVCENVSDENVSEEVLKTFSNVLLEHLEGIFQTSFHLMCKTNNLKVRYKLLGLCND